MERLIQEALEKKKIDMQQAEKIQKNIAKVSFTSPLGKEQAVKESIKWIVRGNRKVQKLLREDKRERGLLKPKGYWKDKRIEKELREVDIPTMLEISSLPCFQEKK